MDAQLNGLNGLNAVSAASVGFNVWDGTNAVSPVETATLSANQKNGLPNLMEFTYSSGTVGPVIIELYNWAQAPVTGTITLLAVPSNGAPLQVSSQKPAGVC